ncbi:hypothetical protein K502DRAFT_326525 [Neoconidiobolus thromboides FSU 785]|nr:hypothetical protein K502DRAFT_326525 [Neoconidiobolus thromboides FSU 785]
MSKFHTGVILKTSLRHLTHSATVFLFLFVFGVIVGLKVLNFINPFLWSNHETLTL